MRTPRSLSFVFLLLTAITPVALAACTTSADDEEVDDAASELVQFPAAAFANAPALTYGATSTAMATSRTQWGVIQWSGAAGDEFVATVAATTPDRLPRAYLVERRDDGKYVAILSGTNSTDGVVKAKLAKTQTYFIVFRDVSRRNASFTVKLDRAGALPGACAGPALVNAGFVERTAQSMEPGLVVTGQLQSMVRRCNVATGCADPVVQNVASSNLTFSRRPDGKWIASGAFNAEHDGATGDLKGTSNVRADDGRNVSVALTGAATTSCVSLSGRNRVEIDPITYYDVEVTYMATTPPAAPRTEYPATPPPAACDGQEPIPDEEVLARFPRGAASVVLGTANVVEDVQYCHPETGCRAWAKGAPNPAFGLRATALVLGASTLGIQFYNTQSGANSQKLELQDGVIPVTNDVLKRGASVASISDTHLLVKESGVFTEGLYKWRRSVCIPIPAHP